MKTSPKSMSASSKISAPLEIVIVVGVKFAGIEGSGCRHVPSVLEVDLYVVPAIVVATTEDGSECPQSDQVRSR